MINETGTNGLPPRTAVLYFPVSSRKLVVMSIVTLGLYQLFWFYKHWRIYKLRTGANITPAARCLFLAFYCYSLFRQIKDGAVTCGITRAFSPGLLAAGWILASLSGFLPAPVSLASLFLPPLLLVPVQATVNELNRRVAPEHNPNERFTGWNIAAIVLGGLVVLIGLIGTLMPQ